MQEIMLKNIQIPAGLTGADKGSVQQTNILPIKMNRIIGGFDETMLTKLGCEEATQNKEQNNAA